MSPGFQICERLPTSVMRHPWRRKMPTKSLVGAASFASTECEEGSLQHQAMDGMKEDTYSSKQFM